MPIIANESYTVNGHNINMKYQYILNGQSNQCYHGLNTDKFTVYQYQNSISQYSKYYFNSQVIDSITLLVQ